MLSADASVFVPQSVCIDESSCAALAINNDWSDSRRSTSAGGSTPGGTPPCKADTAPEEAYHFMSLPAACGTWNTPVWEPGLGDGNFEVDFEVMVTEHLRLGEADPPPADVFLDLPALGGNDPWQGVAWDEDVDLDSCIELPQLSESVETQSSSVHGNAHAEHVELQGWESSIAVSVDDADLCTQWGSAVASDDVFLVPMMTTCSLGGCDDDLTWLPGDIVGACAATDWRTTPYAATCALAREMAPRPSEVSAGPLVVRCRKDGEDGTDGTGWLEPADGRADVDAQSRRVETAEGSSSSLLEDLDAIFCSSSSSMGIGDDASQSQADLFD